VRRQLQPTSKEEAVSTPQSIALHGRIGLGKVAIALGVLVAVAVTVILVALTGANRSVSASQAPISSLQPAQNLSRCVYVRQDHACVRLP
jgi:hypothetical protein